MVVKEPIVTIDDDDRRLVWTVEADGFKHYNSSLQVFSEGAGARVVWTSDFLPDGAAKMVGPLMEQGMAAMKKTMDGQRGG
jgi:hypothetical protein